MKKKENNSGFFAQTEQNSHRNAHQSPAFSKSSVDVELRLHKDDHATKRHISLYEVSQFGETMTRLNYFRYQYILAFSNMPYLKILK